MFKISAYFLVVSLKEAPVKKLFGSGLFHHLFKTKPHFLCSDYKLWSYTRPIVWGCVGDKNARKYLWIKIDQETPLLLLEWQNQVWTALAKIDPAIAWHQWDLWSLLRSCFIKRTGRGSKLQGCDSFNNRRGESFLNFIQIQIWIRRFQLK